MKNQELSVLEENNLFIIFKSNKGIFCVDSKQISTIIPLPDFQTVPGARPFVTGMFMHRNSVIEMFDLRSAFHIPTLNEEYESFSQMIDNRKQDHINWVVALERSLTTGEKFTLATDPHKCAFGKWYDQYPFGDDEASRNLKKVEEPHKRLHEAAGKMKECAQNCDTCERDKCLKEILREAKEECMPVIIGLLDETKESFRSTVYHEMVLILEDLEMGIVVDEVMSVEKLTDVEGQNSLFTFPTSSMVVSVKKSNKWPELILELDFSGLS